MYQHHAVETSADAPLTNSVDLLESYWTGRPTRFRVAVPLVSAGEAAIRPCSFAER